MLLTKTAINYPIFFSLLLGQWIDLRNFKGIEFRNFYLLQLYASFSRKFSLDVKKKCITWGLIQVLPNRVVENPSIRLKTLTYEGSMQSYIKKRVKLWELIQF